MTQPSGNRGFINPGTITMRDMIMPGRDAVVTNYERAQPETGGREACVGVVTVLAVEAAAVRDVLGLHPAPDGTPGIHLGTVRAAGRPATVVAARSLDQGQETAVAAVARLRARYHPGVFILAGIAGAIHPSVRVGDVVVATRVIGYDLRKETPAGIIRRGSERQAPAAATHAVGHFFTALGGDSAELPGGDAAQASRVHYGPIGSGNAVIADERSTIRAWLRDYNDKILAIDMEAAGFATACHDDPDGGPPPWIIVRGISDDASPRKNDGHHQTAATNAARVVRELLAYLPLAGDHA